MLRWKNEVNCYDGNKIPFPIAVENSGVLVGKSHLKAKLLKRNPNSS